MDEEEVVANLIEHGRYAMRPEFESEEPDDDEAIEALINLLCNE